MDQRISKLLEREHQPANITELFTLLQSNLAHSRSVMGKEYSRWRRNLEIYKGNIPADEDDEDAREVGEPEKFPIPLSFAQVQTFVAFAFLLLQQNRRFYEFEPTGEEDDPVRDIAEDLLHGELQENRWPSKLYQALLDVARMGICVTKEVWARETTWIPQSDMPVMVNGQDQTLMELGDGGDQEVIKFEGNRIFNISPFKIFPDMTLPLGRWREGKFIVDEECYRIGYVKDLERRGLMVGTKYIKKLSQKAWDSRSKHNSFEMLLSEFKDDSSDSASSTSFACVVSEHFIRLVPKDHGLGSEEYEVMFLIRIVNDQRIVSIDRYGYIHDEFPHNIGLMSPDTCENLSASLSDTIHSIQDVITYLVNARVLSQRKSLARNLIVNPQVIDLDSIREGSDVITTVQGAPTNGIERYAMQLQYRDTTASNLSDASELQRIMLMVTGVNENAMGQFSPGRRSATENRAANGGAASRMKVTTALLHCDMFAPQGRKQLTNLRYSLSFESFSKYLGNRPDIEQLYELFCPSDPSVLVGNRDVFMFDNTVPSEKGFMAQSMQELLISIIQNPETAQRYDTDALLEEIYALRGVKVRRFRIPASAQIGLGLDPTQGTPGSGAPIGAGGAPGPILPT